jgi:hypothetical protein
MRPPRGTLPARRFGLRLMPMLDRANIIALSSRHLATAGAVLLMLAVSAVVAWPQAASPQPSAPSSLGVAPAQQAAPDQGAPQPGGPAPDPAAHDENSGLFNEMGKLFEKSLSIFPPLKSPQQTIDDWNARARDAGDSLTRLAKPSSMVTGRSGCPVAGNGAPDCKAGADKLCQAKGFREGKSLDTDAAEKCAAKVYLPGYKREPGDCRTENYVTRALCQ